MQSAPDMSAMRSFIAVAMEKPAKMDIDTGEVWALVDGAYISLGTDPGQYERLTAAITKELETDWQPISTVESYGDPVLVGAWINGEWNMDYGRFHSVPHQWYGHSCVEGEKWTHWKRVDPPPKS